MSKKDPAYSIFTPLVTGEGCVSKDDLTYKNCEFGTVKDERKVWIRLPKHGAPHVCGASFEVVNDPDGSSTTKHFKLASNDPLLIIQKLYEYDEAVHTARLRDEVARLSAEVKKCDEKEAEFHVRVCNGATLTPDESKERKANAKEREKSNSSRTELVSTLFLYYKQFLDAVSSDFTTIEREYCLSPCEVEVEKIIYSRKAYAKNSSSEQLDLTQRLPDKDEEETPTSTYGFHHDYSWGKETQRGICRERTLDTLDECRSRHMKKLFPVTGQAEAQYHYLMHNVRVPIGMHMKNFKDFLLRVSRVMYLLPTVKDLANGCYANIPDIVARNSAFSDFTVAQMCMNACPLAVQEKYKADNPLEPMPLDPEKFQLEIEYDLKKYFDEELKKRKDQKKSDLEKKKATGGGNSTSRDAKSSGAGKGSGGAGKKQCSRCVNGGMPAVVFNSHTDEKCEKFKADGSVKKKDRQSFAQEHDPTPRKDKKGKRKKGKKAPKKKGKKKKRKVVTYETDSSADSDDSGSDSDSSSSS